MRAIVSALILGGMAIGALASCRVATEYVPRTPGKATLGVERGAVGVYKNGSFAKLGAPVSAMIGCSAPAAAAASAAAAHDASARFDAAVASAGWALMWLFPPLGGLIFGTASGLTGGYMRATASARGIDAVNLYNDEIASGARCAP